MVSGHTPGPWRVDSDSGNDAEAEVIVAADRTICWTADTFSDEEGAVITDEDRANGRLIAAAPELLAVVRMAIDYANDTKEIFGINFSGDDAESYDNLMDAAEAAINRAEGRDDDA
jgi:hypothetical protein